MSVRLAECPGVSPAWNAFVEGHPQASVFHLLEWQRIIVSAYGHEPHYLAASEPAGVAGVLPLVMIRSRLFGRSLVSLPFADYGGICASDPAVARALLERALAIGGERGADYVQLRQRQPHPAVVGVPGDKVTMLLDLAPDPQALWARLPSERRNR
ncbi:MAG TPA: FemAB-like protein, partial [Methylomirabilota bacterium]|nr:FemAB-like protein [Methylomirabilota bacterium]